VFLAMAMSHGLDSAIADVFDTELMNIVATTEMLMNKQIYSDSFLKVYGATNK
jgi:5-methyltetrahydrofolate corrinoid/iron sulfur protein methyltransferase